MSTSVPTYFANRRSIVTSVPQSQTKEIEPGLVETLIRRWPLLAGGALLGALAAFLNLTLVPSKYESKARVLLVKMHPDMAPGFEANHRGPEDYVATQLGIMQSAAVIENAARTTGPTLQSIGKRNDTTEDILDGLSAKRDSKERNSNIVELSFNCTEPADCPKVLAAVIASYQDYLQKNHATISGKPLKLVKEMNDVFERDLKRKEAEYLAFRRKNPGLQYNGKNGGTAPNELLLSLHAKRLAVRVRRAEIESLLARVGKGWKEDLAHEELIALIAMLPGRASGDGGKQPSSFLEDKLLPALIEDRTLSVGFAPTHPQVMAARKRAEMAHKVVTAILTQELAAVRKAEESLDELYKSQDAEAKVSASAEVEDEIFRNDITRLQQLAESTHKRLLEVEVVKDLGGSAAQVIGPPTVAKITSQSDPMRIYPKGIMLGLLVGAALAISPTVLRSLRANFQSSVTATGHRPANRGQDDFAVRSDEDLPCGDDAGTPSRRCPGHIADGATVT
jgi:uncharacterized protein involved in exopolysaccharide biosynthesis